MGRLFTFMLGGLGWAMGGAIGALIGAAIGSSIDKKHENKNDSSEPRLGGASYAHNRGRYTNTGSSQDLKAALMVLIAVVMKADGMVRQSELDYVKKFLRTNYRDAEAREMLQILKGLMYQQEPIDLDAVCRQIKVNTDYSTRYHMYDFLFGIACADSDFSMAEHLALQEIGRGLGINRADYISIRTRRGLGGAQRQRQQSSDYSGYGGHAGADTYKSSEPDPYSVLGIQSTATDDEVKKAYRRMAMKYHPDRVESLGEEMRRNAEEQFKKINQAYETIKASRGIK